MIHTDLRELFNRDLFTSAAPSQPVSTGTLRIATDGFAVYEREEGTQVLWVPEDGNNIAEQKGGHRTILPFVAYNSERVVQETIMALIQTGSPRDGCGDPRPAEAVVDYCRRQLKHPLSALITNPTWAPLLEACCPPDVQIFSEKDLWDIVYGVPAPEFLGHIAEGPRRFDDAASVMRLGFICHGRPAWTQIAKTP